MYSWSPNGVQTRRGCVRGSHGNHMVVDAPHAKPLWLCAMVPMVAMRTIFVLSRETRDNIHFPIYADTTSPQECNGSRVSGDALVQRPCNKTPASVRRELPCHRPDRASQCDGLRHFETYNDDYG